MNSYLPFLKIWQHLFIHTQDDLSSLEMTSTHHFANQLLGSPPFYKNAFPSLHESHLDS